MCPSGCPSTNTIAYSLLSLAPTSGCTPRAASHRGRRRDTTSYAVFPSVARPAISSAVNKLLLCGAPALPPAPPGGAQAIAAATPTSQMPFVVIGVLQICPYPARTTFDKSYSFHDDAREVSPRPAEPSG